MKNALGLGEYGSDDEQEQQQSIVDDDDLESERTPSGAQATSDAQQQQGEPASAEAAADGTADATGGDQNASPSGSKLADLQGLPPELRQKPPGEPNANLVDKMVALKRTKRSFNDTLRSHKGYKNPDLLTKLVEYGQVDQYGSAFNVDVFNPNSLPEEDKMGSLMAQWERDQERKKLARANLRPEQLRAGAGVEFQRGQGTLGVLPPSAAGSQISLTAAAASAAIRRPPAAAIVPGTAVAAAAALQLQQQLKRSKWDTSAAK